MHSVMEWNVWQQFCAFSAENQPKSLLWSWLSRGMNEWIRYERRSRKTEQELWGQEAVVFPARVNRS